MKNGVTELGVAENSEPVYVTMTPVCESPTSEKSFRPVNPDNNTLHSGANFGQDVAVKLQAGSGGKKSGWRRGSANSRKPTGLASALAASGLAMVNPALQPPQIPGYSSPPRATRGDIGKAPSGRKNSIGSSRQGRSSVDGRSAPPSERAQSPSSNRGKAAVSSNDGHSDIYLEDTGHYSGLEDSDEEDDTSASDGYLSDDLAAHDIPVTGFAVASNKRNADFHELFPNIPEGDYLIEDYGCALQREILIQGRIYISENHICFHANIFGWITDLTIPIYDVTALEKKMTAFVIPNAIQITTRQAKYTFASFLARDTTFDVIYNIWKLARPEDSLSLMEGSSQISPDENPPSLASGPGERVVVSKVTQCSCSKDGSHYPEVAMDTVLPGTPENIYSLIFASGFCKEFMKTNQKLLDIQISDWAPVSPDSNLLTRNMSYIKPLSAPVGPKQTKCEIKDETIHCDFDDFVVMLTTTRTPDVPSGGVFSVKTRTCITWASPISTRVVVTTRVEWTGRSFIKGIIEKSCLDGQKQYHAELDKAMRAYIAEHKSEFIPEGVDLEELAPTSPQPAEVQKSGSNEPKSSKEREHERNQRSLQWAWDTFDGAAQVAQRSTRGAIELIKDAWDQSSTTTILIFVIVFLVFSNLYTYHSMKYTSQTSGRRQEELKKTEEQDKLIQGVVAAIRDETTTNRVTGVTGQSVHWRQEVIALLQILDGVEQRASALRHQLGSLENVD
jgi:hypothetical protein